MIWYKAIHSFKNRLKGAFAPFRIPHSKGKKVITQNVTASSQSGSPCGSTRRPGSCRPRNLHTWIFFKSRIFRKGTTQKTDLDIPTVNINQLLSVQIDCTSVNCAAGHLPLIIRPLVYRSHQFVRCLRFSRPEGARCRVSS